MPYLANKKMNLAGTQYDKGTEVPEETFRDIPDYRQGALLRQRLIIEVEVVPTPPGDMCPHCDEGPFQRLSQHVSMKHADVQTEDLDIKVSANLPEESDGNS